MSSLLPQPNLRSERDKVIKCSRSDDETGPVTKRQRLDEKQSSHIIEVDPDGDVLIQSAGDDTAFRVDSHALRRASAGLYEQCLGVRPANASDSLWIYKKMPGSSTHAATAVLNFIHGNSSPVSMASKEVWDAIQFTIGCGMFERCYEQANRWYQNMVEDSPYVRDRLLCRLMVAFKLGLDKDVIDIQEQAILSFESVDSFDELGYLVRWCFGGDAEELAIDMILKIRVDTVKHVLDELRNAKLALISSRNGPIKGFEGFGCIECRNQWFSCLSRDLRRPELVDSSLKGSGFPCLFPMIDPRQYRCSLERLCRFVEHLQKRMIDYKPGSKSFPCYAAGKKCVPPQLVTQDAVKVVIREALQGCNIGL